MSPGQLAQRLCYPLARVTAIRDAVAFASWHIDC
jgi:hypothetical protein